MIATTAACLRLPRSAAFLAALLLLTRPTVSAPSVVTPSRPQDVSIDAVAAHFSARVLHHPLKDKIELRLRGNRRILFTIFSPVVVVDDIAYRLPHRVEPAPGGVRVPASVREILSVAVPALASIPVQNRALPGEERVPPAGGRPQPLPVPPAAEGTPDPFGPLPGPDLDSLRAVLSIETIVIDPGHGGRDPGAIGRGGLREKKVALEVSRELKRLIDRNRDLRAVMTRSRDAFISLGRRARIARQAGGDLFVSLHCNASKRRGAGGLEVYFLSEAKTEEAAAVAERENASARYDDDEDTRALEELTGIRFTLLSSQFLIESQELAGNVRASLVSAFDRAPDRGVKQANFYVMRGTMGSMPSVLVEMGFITNPNESKQLKSKKYQRQMAKAIYDGLLSFKQTHERQLGAAR